MLATQVPSDVFNYIAKNAGILLNGFDPTKGTVNRSNIMGATTGGIQFDDKVTYTDNGSDVDNMPSGTMEMQEVDSHEVTCTGNFVSITVEGIKDLIGPADLNSSETKITPRQELKITDFKDHLWFLTDYGNGGYIAIRMDNVLNTDGFSLKSTNKGKAQFAFNFKAHYSIDEPDTVPYEIFYKEGTTDETSGEPHSDAVTES